MIAVDAPVLIELLSNGPQADAVESCLRQALVGGRVVICSVTLAELCASLRGGSQAQEALEEMGIHFNPMEAKSALRAGEMQRRHRQRTGESRRMDDFMVGAHALLQCDALITWDDALYRDYFKGLKLIVPHA
ncbi:type II toxin-antitoxin system VapC family toxin [Novilysobacter antarcticus]|uniref:type II toxin-antitoxin system VapC family toxin n=1 Tax=Novilysobacter antarcticus TaxID=2862543 RepID=UPI001C9A03B4|nr:type II toxin-antitoxin system VapC family toxin [Lysobacter antarcticus]